MAAIGTQSVRRRFVDLLVDDVNAGSNTSKYFIGVGKSDTYNDTDTPVAPQSNLRNEMIARANLQSVKQVADCSLVIPRYNWASGAIYSAFSDLTVDPPVSNPYYVITEENDVYICLQQGKDANGNVVTSTTKPSFVSAGVGSGKAFRTSDGYVWKFLYSISAVRSFAFQSAGWAPIQDVSWSVAGDSASLNAFELQQLNVQKSAVAGQILGVRIDAAGSGYTGTPKINFRGNGTGAQATLTLSGGAIVKVEMNNESAALGSGYSFASAELIDSAGNGSGARLTPILGPTKGIGASAIDDLQSSSVMFTIKPDGDEGGSFLTENDFRQITLFRNLQEVDSDGIMTTTRGKALKYMTMANSPASGNFTIDRLIRGVSSNAAAYIDDIDSANIYYHQNEKTGFASFVAGEIIDESDGIGRGAIDSSAGSALKYSLVDAFSGDCLYIENRAAVVRDDNQQEDIKVIITL